MKPGESSVAFALLVCSIAAGRASAQDAAALGGVVRDPQGSPQLGALVELLGPGSTVIARTYTDDHGRYLLAALTPGRYQLRTSAAFLLSSTRSNIRLISGGRTLANMTLGTLFQAGSWFPVERRTKDEPLEDWRWTLRSTAERPLLRFSSADDDADRVLNSPPLVSDRSSAAQQKVEAEVIYGDAGLLQSGLRQVLSFDQEHGNGSLTSQRAVVGSAENATTGEQARSLHLSAGYERHMAANGEFRTVGGLVEEPGISSAAHAGFQAISLATGERIVLGDLVTIDAGTLLSAERLVAGRVSSAPFLRVQLQPAAGVVLSYHYAGSQALQSLDDFDSLDLQSDPTADAKGQPLLNPATHQQLAIGRRSSRDLLTISAYRDVFAQGILSGTGGLREADFAALPVTVNLASGDFRMLVRGYTAGGAQASWTHTFAPNLQAKLQAGFGTTLERQALAAGALNSVQADLRECEKPYIAADLAGTLPNGKTTFKVGYRWQPRDTLATIDVFDQPAGSGYAGVTVKQQVWSGKQVRSVHAVIEASNLLQEGYQPVLGPDGRTLFLAQVPRSIQAGLVFSF